MRIWSLHPRYLDSKGLVAGWREGLLAQKVLAGETRGYKHHPQLERFKKTESPIDSIAFYLRILAAEAENRKYNFNISKILDFQSPQPMSVTVGQLAYEWNHLTRKLKERAPAWMEKLGAPEIIEPHPLFTTVGGDIETWEIV